MGCASTVQHESTRKRAAAGARRVPAHVTAPRNQCFHAALLACARPFEHTPLQEPPLPPLEPLPYCEADGTYKATCKRCGRQETVALRCTEKVAASASRVCKLCGSKESTLRRMFGKWPIESFKPLTEEAKSAFYRQIADPRFSGAGKSDQVVDLITETISAQEIHRRTERTKGEYLPPSWYKGHHFNWEAIEQNCKNTRFCETQQVMTYKLDITGDEIATIREEVRSQLQELRAAAKKEGQQSVAGKKLAKAALGFDLIGLNTLASARQLYTLRPHRSNFGRKRAAAPRSDAAKHHAARKTPRAFRPRGVRALASLPVC